MHKTALKFHLRVKKRRCPSWKNIHSSSFSSTTPPIPLASHHQINSSENNNELHEIDNGLHEKDTTSTEKDIKRETKQPTLDLSSAIAKLQKVLYIQNMEDWYEIPKTYITTFGEKALAKQYPTVEELVRAAYPAHAWDTRRFAYYSGGRAMFTPQTFMARIVRAIFPRETQERNARAGHGITGASGRSLEVDVYLPNLKLGFEYQDPHHYFRTSYGQHTLADYQNNDKIKQQKAEELGITLINVPFWWNWDKESLIATIISKLPDLAYLSKMSDSPLPSPLSDDPPPHISAKFANEVPGLGTPMLAIHAPTSRTFDPTKWWLMEKYDGIRAVWNSEQREVFSRWGKIISLPFFISDTLPSGLWLDAEIWFGRKKGTRYQAIALSRPYNPQNIDWNSFQLMVFDTPDPLFRHLSYKERYTHLLTHFPPGTKKQCITLSPYFIPPSESLLSARQFVEDLFFKIRAQGGEGIIMRNPEAKYEHGYSKSYFKHKGFLDAEALIIAKKSENTFIGKVSKEHLFRNMITSPSKEIEEDGEEREEREAGGNEREREIEISEGKEERTREEERMEERVVERGGKEDEDGEFFEVEMSVDEELFDGEISNVTKGMFVSFRYSGEISSLGPPKNPKIYAIRSDITSWPQLLHSKSVPPGHQTVWTPPLPVHYSSLSQRKVFFDNFAKARGFDPRVADNWYSVSQGNILDSQGGGPVLHYYNFSPSRALLDVYPDIGLEVHKFIYKPKRYWVSQENRKRFFTELAKTKGFKIEEVNKWYTLPYSFIQNQPGGPGLLQYYKKDIPAALRETFPELGLEESKFVSRKGTKYRRFFDSFALENNFDPLIPSNWYSVKPAKISHSHEGKTLLKHFNNSLFDALVACYPDIGISKSGWMEARGNHKRVFLGLAASLGFDPLVPDNWYKLNKNDLYNFKGMRTLLDHYDNSLGAALVSTFPNIGLNESKFHTVDPHKDFLESFALKRGFDPLLHRNWLNISSVDIRKEKGGIELLKQYGNSIMNVVLEVYPKSTT